MVGRAHTKESVIKLKNSNGNATITLFTPKVDLEK